MRDQMTKYWKRFDGWWFAELHNVFTTPLRKQPPWFRAVVVLAALALIAAAVASSLGR